VICHSYTQLVHLIQTLRPVRFLVTKILGVNFIFFLLLLIRNKNSLLFPSIHHHKDLNLNHLGGSPVVKVWDQEVCSLYGLKFEPCGYSYDGHWRLTWSLISGPVGLVEVRTSWPGHPR
jgi:hypothetical protein